MASYNEGGNTLMVPAPDGGSNYAFVGEDTIAVTTHLRNVNPQEALALVARDLGIHPDRVVVLPQADFHVDMCIRPMPNGVILVNDPAMSNGLAAQYINQLGYDQDWSQAQLSATLTKLEAIANSGATLATQMQTNSAIAALEAAGYTVERVPGAFAIPNPTNNTLQHYNLMNMVSGISPKDGANIGIVGGAPGLLQGQMAQIFFENGMDRVHFTSPALANALLMNGQGGGINCITKLPGHNDQFNLIPNGQTVRLGGGG